MKKNINRKKSITADLSTSHCSIAVIGGGPAGSTIARRLALLGHEVCLIEKENFPRRHIGESLPPGILPVLDAIGLRERIEKAGFLRPDRTLLRWADKLESDKTQPGAPGFQVDRGRFDQLLLDAAAEAGAKILQPARVSQITSMNNGGWVLQVKTPESAITLEARFLVDASGKGVLPAQPQRNAATTLAIYGYWHNILLSGPETRVEAADHAWYWGAPLPDGSFNAVVFIDTHDLHAKGKTALEAVYRQKLAASSLLAPCLTGSLISPVMACDATPRFDRNSIGRHFIKVGDAALKIDPLSSQGVQTAIMSALQGSIVVHSLLTQPERCDSAIAFYNDRQWETVQRHARWSAQAYADQYRITRTPFWENRSEFAFSENEALSNTPINIRVDPAQRVRLCPQASLKTAPTLHNDTIAMFPALSHPSLPRPVAFVGGIEIYPVLAIIEAGDTPLTIVTKISRFLSRERSLSLVHWLLQHHILIAA